MSVWSIAPAVLTLGFLLWTAWLFARPSLYRQRDDSRTVVAERLDHVEKALQDLVVGVAVIPQQPSDEALRRWRVLFVTYRNQIKEMEGSDPAVQEIAEYLSRLYVLVGQAEQLRKDILAAKFNPDEAKVRDLDFRRLLEAGVAEVHAASQKLRSAIGKDQDNPLEFPAYPIAASLLMILLTGSLIYLGSGLRTAPGQVIEVLPSPWANGLPGYSESLDATGEPLGLLRLGAAAARDSNLEPAGLGPLRRMAGRFAHNFNNLLTTINGYADLLLFSLDAKDPNRHDIEEIKKAGDRAAFVTGQLLAFSGRQVVKPVDLDVNEALHRMEPALGAMVGNRIEIELDLSPDLDHVRIDPAQLEQVTLSLVINARDAMPGGGRLTISSASAKPHMIGPRPRPCQGPSVILTFRDTGIGMEETTRDQIFEPFFTTHEPGKGTGLGLSTAYGIIKQNGGNVRVRTEPGKGTTFTVYLPTAQEGAEWAGASQLKKEQSRFKVGSLRSPESGWIRAGLVSLETLSQRFAGGRTGPRR